jgi:hypothetical protein
MNILSIWKSVDKSLQFINRQIGNFIDSTKRQMELRMGRAIVKTLRLLYKIGFTAALAITISGLVLAASNYRAMAQSSPWPIDSRGVPKIGEVTAQNFVTFDRDQCFAVAQEAAYLMGGTELCTKEGGNFSDLPLSVMNTMFKAGDEPLGDMLRKGGADPAKITLTELPLVGKSSLQEFVKSIGELKSPVSVMVTAQLAANGLTLPVLAKGLIPTNQAIFQQFPQIANNPFDVAKLGSDLKISKIPGLEKTLVKNIAGAVGEKIKNFPNLAQRPFGSFPSPPQVPSADISFVKMNVALKGENISGNGRIITDVPCTENCDGFEIAGLMPNSPVNGERVVSGDNQQARRRDGHGWLNAIGGDAPTGDFPLGKKVFKRSFHDINPAKGTASWAMSFQICQEGFPDLGCTPNNIGPFRVGSLSEKNGVFMKNGLANALATNPLASGSPANLAAAESNPVASAKSLGSKDSSPDTNVAEINVDKLQQAFKNADISNINPDQLKAKIVQAYRENSTLKPETIINKITLDLVAGSNVDPRAVNPVTGQSAAEITKRIVTYYGQGS